MNNDIRTYVLKKDDIVELPYYGIRVFSSSYDRQKLDTNKSLARLILFLGLSLVIISSVDISKASWTITQSEQSIWPSSGKGIWIGLFVMAIGVFTLIAVKEKTHSAFYILLPYVIIGICLCFFGLLTSIIVLEHYTKDPYLSQKKNQNKQQGVQYALNGLLIGIFALTFLLLSCLSCMVCWTIPNFCQKYQGINPRLFNPPSQRFYARTPQSYHQPIILNFPRHRYAINRAYRA